jgi:hypothetical protein
MPLFLAVSYYKPARCVRVPVRACATTTNGHIIERMVQSKTVEQFEIGIEVGSELWEADEE